MIDIKINLNNVSNSVNINSLIQDLKTTLENLTNQTCNVNLNMNDNNSMSPLGIHLTKDYLNFRDRI